MKFTLKHPLKLGEKSTLAVLTFRDYTTAADYLAFDQRGGVAQMITLIASLSGVDEEVIKQLRGADYVAARNIVNRLLDADEGEGGSVQDGETAAAKKDDASS